MRSLFLLTALICSLSMAAQTSFKPGFVILNSGDTVRGEIEEATWSISPESVQFRKGGNTQRYKVTDLKEFNIDDAVWYIRYHFTYQQTATELEYADETFDGPAVTTDAWLRLLYAGRHSLYEFKTLRRTYYYYTGTDGDLKELIYRVRHTVSGELEKDEQYKNRLSMLTPEGDAEAYQRQVNNARYTEEDLVKVFTLLNGEKGNFKASSSMSTRIDISGGVNLYTFSPKGALYNDGTGAYAIYMTDFKASIGFIAGVGFTFYSKRNPKALQSRLGVNIASVKIDGLNMSGVGSFQREKYDGTLIVAEPNASVDLPLSVSARSSFLLGASFGYNIVISNNFKSVFENPGVVIERKNFPPADGGFINFGIGATAIFGKNRFNLRAFNFSNIFDSPQTNLKGFGFSLTYGYYLK